MKKLLLSILLTLLPILASAEIVEINGIYYFIIPKAKLAEVVMRYDQSYYSADIDIPASFTYNDAKYSVTSIGAYAFSGCSGLTSIKIPNSVTSIGDYAFSGCSCLTTINIPNCVISIGKCAFQNCSSLSSVTIPNSVTSIHRYAFADCIGLTTVTIPNSVTSIESGVFQNCSVLTSVTIPNCVTSIGDYAFSGCSCLTTINIPNCVISIGECAFQNCSSLSSVTISNSVTSISDCTFQYCKSLTSVKIPNSVTSIGDYSFDGCSDLSSVTISNSVTSIGSWAFSNSGLSSVTIPTSVTSIGWEAFANCDEMTDVYCLAEQVPYTHSAAFQYSYPQYMTLHVPAASIEAYRSTQPWIQFKTIVPLEDDDNPEIKKCATPEISYANGKVSLSCETEGVDFISEVTVADAKKYYDSEFTLSQTYKITVYATKAGYENSDVATREIVIENGQTTLFGDINKDGKVNVADHVKLSDIIMNK